MPQRNATGAAQAYRSEFTDFIDRYLGEHPEIVVDQHRGFAIYWDKRVDFAAQAEAAEDSVPVDAYYYFGNPRPH